jgi:hypothetical protein
MLRGDEREMLKCHSKNLDELYQLIEKNKIPFLKIKKELDDWDNEYDEIDQKREKRTEYWNAHPHKMAFVRRYIAKYIQLKSDKQIVKNKVWNETYKKDIISGFSCPRRTTKMSAEEMATQLVKYSEPDGFYQVITAMYKKIDDNQSWGECIDRVIVPKQGHPGKYILIQVRGGKTSGGTLRQKPSRMKVG